MARRFSAIRTALSCLGEIPDQLKALREIAGTLKPGGMLSVTETVFDPHFQRRGTVSSLVGEAGLVPVKTFGNNLSFTMHFIKPYPEKEEHAPYYLIA